MMPKLNCKATAGCLVKSNGKLVLVYEEQSGHSHWDIPAGGVKVWETPEQAIRRELQEEVGLQVIGGLHLTHIFWAKLAGVPTVHFLYKLTIDDASGRTLSPNTEDVQKVARFSRHEIRVLIDTGAYEHKLAKTRLQIFLDSKKYDSNFVCLT